MSKLIRLIAAVNGLAVVVLGAARLDWPTAFWTNRVSWLIVALVTTALVPLLQLAIAERGEKARRIALEREQKIETFLVAALIHLVRTTRADWLSTGVQAFVTKGWWRPRHVRIAKVRLGPIPSSGVEWARGKGVIGRCWETRTPQFEDLQERFAAYQACDETRWEALSHEDRFGLTFEDFQRLGQKYGIVAAVPIIDKAERHVGCITADAPPTTGASPWKREEVLESLATTAQLVREVL